MQHSSAARPPEQLVGEEQLGLGIVGCQAVRPAGSGGGDEPQLMALEGGEEEGGGGVVRGYEGRTCERGQGTVPHMDMRDVLNTCSRCDASEWCREWIQVHSCT